MYPLKEFNSYNIGKDPYQGVGASISLAGLTPKDESLPIQLSVVMSTYHRVSQLRRSLECFARQDWKNFEIVICDDGDDNDLSPIYAEFDPYLRIKHIRRERTKFHVDPTGGFRAALPLVEGDVLAIMQPELMLAPAACRMLYYGHFEDIPDSIVYSIKNGVDLNSAPTWVVLRTLFLSPEMQKAIDSVDWHTSVHGLQNLSRFWEEGCGLGGKTNREWLSWPEYPWWFIASAPRTDPVWTSFPEYLGHASIDFYLIGYRAKVGYKEILPNPPLAYHQDHHRFSIGVVGEAEQIVTDVVREVEKRTAL